MSETTLLPAIQSHVGDWNYYVTTLTFNEVAALIKAPDEIHKRKELSTWIQREVIEKHSEAIINYIQQTKQRFLGALIVGIYDGDPTWAPLDVSFKTNALSATAEQQEKIIGKLGFLKLTGDEKLFAIDGQHRVAGIKAAIQKLEDDDPVRQEEVAAIFVGHNASTAAGKIRTRRLFTTVNSKAKRISAAATIALDEDNGFAIVTRQFIDSHWLFEDGRKHISYTSSGSIPPSAPKTITSVVGLYEIVKELYGPIGKTKFASERPTDQLIKSHTAFCIEYLDELLKQIPEYKQVFVEKIHAANDFRSTSTNHLLFRPAGQRVFARATRLLTERGKTTKAAISILRKVDLDLFNPIWSHLLWNPISERMVINQLLLAETQLLLKTGQPARTTENETKLKEFLKSLS